jgi:hypothetical protein
VDQVQLQVVRWWLFPLFPRDADGVAKSFVSLSKKRLSIGGAKVTSHLLDATAHFGKT